MKYLKINTGLFGLHSNVDLMTNQIKLDQLLADLIIIQQNVINSSEVSIEDI